MEPLRIYLPADLKASLEDEASRQGLSTANLVRTGLRVILKMLDESGGDSAPLRAAKSIDKAAKTVAPKTGAPLKGGRSGQRKTWLALIAAAIIGAGVLASPEPAAAWYRHGYAQPYYGNRGYDPGAAIALGVFGGILGGLAASQGGYGYAPAYQYQAPAYTYYNNPGYSYSPGPCPQWWDGYSWNYSCN